MRASPVAIVAIALASCSARAGVIHVDPPDIIIPMTGSWTPTLLDLNGDGPADVELIVYFLSVITPGQAFGQSGTEVAIDTQPPWSSGSGPWAMAQFPGVVIGPAQTWDDGGLLFNVLAFSTFHPGHWMPPSPMHNVGFRMNIAGQWHYGWLRATGLPQGTGNPEMVIHEWAWESQPNTPIVSGDIGHPCQPDLTGGAVPGQPGYGTPNGVLNNDDFFYFLSQFAAGNLAVADMTTGAVPGVPGYGVPNGVITNDDFFYYLNIFAAGC